MNNTKWREIFQAFYEIECTSSILIPWMTKDTESGYVYGWDSTWTHFGADPEDYERIDWLKIKLSEDNRDIVLSALAKIHVPGEVFEEEVIVYGYRTNVDYISSK